MTSYHPSVNLWRPYQTTTTASSTYLDPWHWLGGSHPITYKFTFWELCRYGCSYWWLNCKQQTTSSPSDALSWQGWFLWLSSHTPNPMGWYYGYCSSGMYGHILSVTGIMIWEGGDLCWKWVKGGLGLGFQIRPYWGQQWMLLHVGNTDFNHT